MRFKSDQEVVSNQVRSPVGGDILTNDRLARCDF
jgi:hypothetical protein